MEMAGWIRLGVLVLVALIVVAFVLRPKKKKAKRTQRGDAPENPYTMSGPPNDGI